MKRYLVFLAVGAACLLSSCPWAVPPDRSEWGRVLWSKEGYGIDGSHDGVIAGGILYQPEAYRGGIGATRLSDGRLEWRISDLFYPGTACVVVAGKVYIFSEQYSDAYGHTSEALLWCIDAATGTVLARGRLVAPPQIIQHQPWLVERGGWLYFGGYVRMADDTEIESVYRIDLADLGGTDGSVVDLGPERFLELTRYQTIASRPLVSDELFYFFLQGWGWRGPLPEGEPMTDNYYPQDAVCVVATDPEGALVWEAPLEHAGIVGDSGGENMIRDGDRLYLGDYSGRACLTTGGELLWEVAGISAISYLVLDGQALYGTCDSFLLRFDAGTGAEAWRLDTDLSLDSNAIVAGGYLLCIAADGALFVDKEGGQLRLKVEEWGIPGYRYQGYIPYSDGIAYILRSEEIIALELVERNE